MGPKINCKNYFFGSVAFKINASSPAGINPVVNNNFNLIPKSGMWATNWGKEYSPIPKESDKANIFILSGTAIVVLVFVSLLSI